MITIEHRMLAPETLDNLLSQFVLREGTDYGIEEISFEVKKKKLLQRLQNGEANIIYDSNADECDILQTK